MALRNPELHAINDDDDDMHNICICDVTSVDL